MNLLKKIWRALEDLAVYIGVPSFLALYVAIYWYTKGAGTMLNPDDTAYEVAYHLRGLLLLVIIPLHAHKRRCERSNSGPPSQ